MTNDLNIQLVVVGCYLLMLVVLGLVGWLQTGTGTDEYYVAGRGQGWIVTSLTIAATYFSSMAVLGVPGLVHQHGLGLVGGALVTIFAGTLIPVIGIPVWRIGKRRGFITQAEMFSDHYGGNAIRLAISGVGAAYCVTYVVMQIVAGGYIFERIFGDSLTQAWLGMDAFEAGTLLLALVTAAYTIVGGMRSVAWTDAVQGLMLLAGMIGAAVLTLLWLGGPGNIFAEVSDRDPSRLTLPGPLGAFPILFAFTLNIGFAFGNMLQPAQWMRYYSAGGPRVLARSAVVVGIVLTATMVFSAPITGLGGWLLFPEMTGSEADSVVLRIVDEAPVGELGMPRWVVVSWSAISGVFMTAVMAASMSTADSNLHAMSAMLARDVYRPYIKPSATEHEVLRVGKACVAILTGIALGFVLLGPVDAIAFIAFIAVSIALQLLPATVDMLFLKRGTSAGAVSGLLAGSIALLFFSAPPTVVSMMPWLAELKNWLGIHFGVWGLAINITIFALVSTMSTPHQQANDKPASSRR